MVVGRRLDPYRHRIPTLQQRSGRRLLVDHDSVHDLLASIRIRSLQEQPVIVPDKPGVQGLHSPKVGHLDGRFAQFRSPRSMVRRSRNQSRYL